MGPILFALKLDSIFTTTQYLHLYGPYFIRLEAGWKGIGIHGTDDEHLHEIGMDASHGCLRMANDDLLEVVSMSMKGQKVVILESLN